MICKFYDLAEMLSAILVVFFLIVCFYFATLIIINLFKIKKLKEVESNAKN